jgi:hypothetical protein
MVLPSENCDSSSIKIDLEDKNKIENTQSHIEKEENVALKVDGVPTIEDDNGYNIYHDDSDNKNLDNNPQQHQFSNTSDVSSNDGDNDNHNKDDLINSPLPQRGSLEPSTREGWQKFKDFVFP